MHYRATRPLAILAVVLSSISVGCASSNMESSAPGGSTSASTAANAMTGAAGLFTSLGGAPGVQALASSFGVNLAANPAVAKFLDATAIDGAKSGLYNQIAQANGQALGSGPANLLSALSGKGLDAAAVTGVGQALSGAATSSGVKPDQMAAITSMWEPIGKSLLAGE